MRISMLVLLLGSSVALAQSAGQPAVKKSEPGICHARGTATYERTKHFEPYDTMDACLASGGRVAKNAPGNAGEKLDARGSSWLGAIGRKALAIVGILVVVGGAFLMSRRRAA
jgi:hypothetical protein